MKLLKIILIPIALAYLSIAGLYMAFQRNLIYYPTPLNGTTPKKYSLPFQDVKFTASDGVSLAGWWIQHPGHNVQRPILLYCHGNAANLSTLAEVSRIYYDFGFDELLFDYRSYGDSQKTPLSEQGVDADALAAYQWLKAKGYKDGQIIIWGHSLGSSVAAWLAVQTHPAGLILEGAFPSMYAVSRNKNPWLVLMPFMIFDKFNTGKYAAERTCPLLEIHVEKDTIIPIGLGRKVYEIASEPKQWLTVKGINHNDFPLVAGQYKTVIQDFAKKCLTGSRNK